MGRSGTIGSEGLRRFADLSLPPGGFLVGVEAPGQDLTWGQGILKILKLYIYIYKIHIYVFILFFWDIILGFHQFLRDL